MEPSQEYAEVLKTLQLPSDCSEVVVTDALSYLQNCEESSFDLIVAFDVIEHLEKDAGLRLLAEMKRVARKKIAILTPYDFMPQHFSSSELDPWGFHETELQTHKSGWLPIDFVGASTLIRLTRFHVNSTGIFDGLFVLYELAKNKVGCESGLEQTFFLSSQATTLDWDRWLQFHSMQKQQKREVQLFGRLFVDPFGLRTYGLINHKSRSHSNAFISLSKWKFVRKIQILRFIKMHKRVCCKKIYGAGFSPIEKLIIGGIYFGNSDTISFDLKLSFNQVISWFMRHLRFG